jgi:3-oxoadipate enol-lactonase
MPDIRSRGLRITYDVIGDGIADGPPVVFLHGLSNHRWMWAPQLATVTTAGYRAVLIDLPGHGRSDPVTEPTTTVDLAHDVVAVLDHLGEAQAVLCGLSLGAMVALQLLVDHPDRVRAALVASTGPSLTFPGAAGQIAGWNELWRSENGPVRRLDATWSFLTTLQFRTSPTGKAFCDSWRAVLRTVSGEGLAGVATGLLQFDTTASLQSVRVPVLVVGGQHDSLAGPDIIRVTASLIPGSRVEIVTGAGHLVNLERPDAFNRLLAGFLAGLSPGDQPARA